MSDLPTSLPDDLPHSGRMGLVAESIRLLKAGVGREVAIGAWLSGPFTLAWQCLGAEAWLGQLHDSPRILAQLGALAQWLARVGEYYFEAGADFLTVHEMGGSPQVIGPANFRALVKPSLARLFDALPSPKVLSVCGDTNASVADLAVCGADALSVDHLNDLSRTRRLLGPDAVLLGNFDPVGVLSHATPAQITSAVQSILSAGANAIWPGCDLWPEVPSANFHALMAAVRVNDSHAAVRE
ncbi:MAG: hypothetical protein HY259_02000 [Chloroflexi bacterium]|nr:hypothetical protein [Chloroflexota bacterium]